MVIGRAEWFKRRKYGGWGLFPATWQGWTYLLVFIALVMIIQIIPFIDYTSKLIITLAIVFLVIIDTITIMFSMKKDEREKIHEAIAERNALWAIIAVLVIGVGYQAARSAVLKTVAEVDWFLIIALLAGVIIKAVSNFYLDRKN